MSDNFYDANGQESGFDIDGDLDSLLNDSLERSEKDDNEDTSKYFTGQVPNESMDGDRAPQVAHSQPQEVHHNPQPQAIDEVENASQEVEIQEQNVYDSVNAQEVKPTVVEDPAPEANPWTVAQNTTSTEQHTPPQSVFDSQDNFVPILNNPQPNANEAAVSDRTEETISPVFVQQEKFETSNVNLSHHEQSKDFSSENGISFDKSKISIPTTLDELNKIRRTINVINALRSIDSNEKLTASRFINNGEEITDEAEYVLAAINVDRRLAQAMTILKTAKGLDAVERSFVVIDLDDDMLKTLGSVVEVFTEDDINSSQGRSIFAKSIVKGIEKIDSQGMRYIEATEKILKAAQGD